MKTKKNKPAPRETRQLILDTALQLFTDKGYFNASVHDIKRSADISIGSIYHHFRGKEEIAYALREDLLDDFTAVIQNILQTHERTEEIFRAILQHLFNMAESQPEKIHYMLTANHKEFVSDGVPICSSKPFQMMMDIVRNGMETEEIRKGDPITISACLFGGGIRMIHLYLDGILKNNLNDYFEETFTASWNAVKK